MPVLRNGGRPAGSGHEPRDIVSLLIGEGLVSRGAVVAGDVRVAEVSRRNRNFRVLTGAGPSYLVKCGVGGERAGTLAREARVYGLLQGGATKAGLDGRLPRFYRFLPGAAVLVLECLEPGENLREYHARRGPFSPAHARGMGEALRRLHSFGGRGAGPGADGGLALAPPWILSIHHLNLRGYTRSSQASLEVVKMVQHLPDFGERLDALRAAWRREALIHFDVKWDNWILASGGRRPGIRLVDWELAGMGDPLWDVGSVFADYLSLWLLSLPMTGAPPDAGSLRLASFPLERMQPSIVCFWRAYGGGRGGEGAPGAARLAQAVRYAAARLLQAAFEQMHPASSLSANVVLSLQLSLNMLRDPEAAAARLLGLGVNGAPAP